MDVEQLSIDMPVDQVDLDVWNPRLRERPQDQSAVLNALFRMVGPHTVELVRDICEVGLNPGDPCYVVYEGGRPVIVEGNRRVAGLRALHNPELVEDHTLRDRFQRLKERHPDAPSAVPTKTFRNRREANVWIRRKHGGEQSGVGTKTWSAWETAVFTERETGRTQLHVALLRWLEHVYSDDQAMLDLVQAIRADHLTTLDRLLFVDIRPLLGLTFDNDQLVVGYSAAQLRPFLHRWFTDLTTGRLSDQPWSRATAATTLGYFNDHSGLLPQPEDQDEDLATPAPPLPPLRIEPAEDTVASPQVPLPAPLGPPPALPAPAPAAADRLFPGVDFKQFGPGIADLAKQAQTVSISSQPRVAGVLLRVLIELCCTTLLERHQKKVPDELWRLVCAAVRLLAPDVGQKTSTSPALDEVLLSSDGGQSGLAVPRMHAFVHSTLFAGDASQVRQLEQLYRPLVVAAARNLGQSI